MVTSEENFSGRHCQSHLYRFKQRSWDRYRTSLPRSRGIWQPNVLPGERFWPSKSHITIWLQWLTVASQSCWGKLSGNFRLNLRLKRISVNGFFFFVPPQLPPCVWRLWLNRGRWLLRLVDWCRPYWLWPANFSIRTGRLPPISLGWKLSWPHLDN